MRRRNRVDVTECSDQFIFIDDARGRFPIEYLAKNTFSQCAVLLDCDASIIHAGHGEPIKEKEQSIIAPG